MNVLNDARNLTICFVFDDKIQDLKKPSCDFNGETYGSVHGKLTTLLDIAQCRGAETPSLIQLGICNINSYCTNKSHKLCGT